MSIEAGHSSAKVAETIITLQYFMKNAPRELGMSWAALVILATLRSNDVAFLSTAEIIERTGLNRGWVYRNIRILSRRGLVDSVEQRRRRNLAQKLYTVNGKGTFYLTQALRPNGVSMIKAFEGQG